MTNLNRLNCDAFGQRWSVNPPSGGDGRESLVIKKGNVPEKIESPVLAGLLYSASESEFLIDVKNIVRLHIADGKTITYEPYPNANENDVFPFIISAGAIALMYQCRAYFISGSGFVLNDQGVLIIGKPSAGKSAIQAYFHKALARSIADEICHITFDIDDRPMLIPGFPFIQIWRDIIKKIDIDRKLVSKLRDNIEKHVIDVSSTQVKKPFTLSKLFVLETDRSVESPRIEPLAGMEKIKLARESFFRPHWIKTFGLQPHYFLSTAKMMNNIESFKVSRPEGNFTVEETAKLIEEKCK